MQGINAMGTGKAVQQGPGGHTCLANLEANRLARLQAEVRLHRGIRGAVATLRLACFKLLPHLLRLPRPPHELKVLSNGSVEIGSLLPSPGHPEDFRLNTWSRLDVPSLVIYCAHFFMWAPWKDCSRIWGSFRAGADLDQLADLTAWESAVCEL